VLLLTISSTSSAQFPWQKPPPRSRKAVARILGPTTEKEPSRDLNIVWVWGIDKLHEKGTHEYAWVMDTYVNELLPQVPRVTVAASMYFPKKELWEKADLVVFYLWPREQWDYHLIDAYQKRGGGLIFIHMALMQGSGQELANRIGMAWDHRNGATKWGVLTTPVTLTDAALESPIFEGFPAKFETTLMTSPAGPAIANKALNGPPNIEDLDGKDWPVMWTREVGRGKVFVTVVGHNYFTFNDPYFRIILLRAMAWAMNESFDPFKPLVTAGIKLRP
jgi:hypothetical protein